MKRRSVVTLASVAVFVIGGGTTGALIVLEHQAVEAQAVDSSGLRSVTVERGSLAQGTVLSGTLSRGTPLPLNANSGGIVTWLPRTGAVIAKGGRLIESNGRPLFLLQGEVPLWRPLQLGDQGKDVASLNKALEGAGLLDRSKVDDVFGAGTSAAIAALFHQTGYEAPSETEDGRERIEQARSASRGAEEDLAAAKATLADSSKRTETTEPSDDGEPVDAVQMLDDATEAVATAEKRLMDASEDVKVAESQRITPEDAAILDVSELLVSSVPARVGDVASGPVIEWTGPEIHAEGQVTRSQQSSLSAGNKVTVSLPDGNKVRGTIATVDGSDVGEESGPRDSEGSLGAGSGSGDMATFRVKLESQKGLADLAGAVVRIEVTSASVDDALVVPVTALVALAEGGYAVEKVTTGGSPERWCRSRWA